jgi:hypothetical protein
MIYYDVFLICFEIICKFPYGIPLGVCLLHLFLYAHQTKIIYAISYWPFLFSSCMGMENNDSNNIFKNLQYKYIFI